jgi:hypothetical protein
MRGHTHTPIACVVKTPFLVRNLFHFCNYLFDSYIFYQGKPSALTFIFLEPLPQVVCADLESAVLGELNCPNSITWLIVVSFHGYLSFGCGLQAVPRVLGLVARLPLSVASGTLVPIF